MRPGASCSGTRVSSPRARRGGKPVPRAPRFALLLLVLAGCAPRSGFPARPSPAVLPPGSPLLSRTLAEPDAWLRHHLMFGEHPQAIDALRPGSALAPGDRLLRALQEAVVLHQAGDFRRSNQLLEWAETEADLRYTRSLRREVASLLVNDRVLAYTPSGAELAMVPYYRMLNYLALGDRDGALVEARKANALLSRMKREPVERCHEDGLVQYLAGLVLRDGGELNDALVSLRQAERSLSACGGETGEAARSVAVDLFRAARAAGLPEIADSVAQRHRLQADSLPAEGGDVLILVEHGFVAHRTGESLHVPLLPDDLKDLDSGNVDGIFSAAARISERLLQNRWERRAWGRGLDDHPAVQWASALDGAYILRLAWPEYRLEAQRPTSVRIRLGEAVASAARIGDLSTVILDEMEEERAALLTRMVARGVVKYLASREVEKKAEKKGGDAAAFVLGRLANLAGNHLEKADTRSWSLLPDRVSMLRRRLPAGVHRVVVEVPGPDGQPGVTQDLGEMRVQPGRLTVLRSRVWGAEAGELPPLRAPHWAPEPDSTNAAAPEG